MNLDVKNTIIENLDIEYRKRRSLEIQIKPEGRVRVLAPKGASEEWIMKAIKSKEAWIIEKLNSVSERIDNKPKLRHGERILDAGDLVTLNIGCHDGLYPVERTDGHLNVHVLDEWRENESKLSSLLIDWYTENTRKKVLELTNRWSAVLKVSPNAIRIKDQKRRWGSCSSKGNVNFNWRLSMAPDSVLEYVVVHELCHFHHMNHSKDFWNLVERMIPDYKLKRKWLKEHGEKMFWLG